MTLRLHAERRDPKRRLAASGGDGRAAIPDFVPGAGGARDLPGRAALERLGRAPGRAALPGVDFNPFAISPRGRPGDRAVHARDRRRTTGSTTRPTRDRAILAQAHLMRDDLLRAVRRRVPLALAAYNAGAQRVAGLRLLHPPDPRSHLVYVSADPRPPRRSRRPSRACHRSQGSAGGLKHDGITMLQSCNIRRYMGGYVARLQQIDQTYGR